MPNGTPLGADSIRSVLVGLCGNRGVLRRMGRTLGMVLERFDPSTSQLEWRTDVSESDWGEAPCEVDLVGYNSVYRMTLEAGGAHGDRLVTPLPTRILRIRHRRHRRFPAPVGTRVRFHHPLWQGVWEVARDAVDLSFSGIGVRARPEDLVFPGLLPPLLELHTDEGQTIRLRGEIRHVSTVRADGMVLCGLSVQPHTADEARWLGFVSQASAPATRTSEDLEDGLWDVFVESGYLDLAGKPTAPFEARRIAFRETAAKAAHVPQLLCQTAWPAERGVEATFSTMKAYRNAWVTHQLAKRPRRSSCQAARPGQILRDLYVRIFEHSQGDPDCKWVVCFVEALNPWIAAAHVRYAERQMETGTTLCFARQIHMLEVFCSELTGRTHEGISVESATPGDRNTLADTIVRTHPACYVEALDFTRAHMDLGFMQARWGEFGLERERGILVARRDGVPVAAIVLELTQEGTNMYNLMDMARLFRLTDAGPSTYVALIDAARRWYTARNRVSFHYICEDEGGAYVQEAGVREGPDPYLWILSSELIPDFLEHVSVLTNGRRVAPTTHQG